MFTCSKTYTDIPFAHRQHRHGGHCALVHGHNWSLRFSFACEQLDGNGFVVDFGDLKYIRAWIDETLDHACLFNEDDPFREKLVASAPDAKLLRRGNRAFCLRGGQPDGAQAHSGSRMD